MRLLSRCSSSSAACRRLERDLLRRAPLAAAALYCLVSAAQAQGQDAGAAAAAPATPASAPVAETPPPKAPASGAAAPAALQRVQISGSTAGDADTRERRESTAAKIIVGREEIERFGDSSVSDVLKRLPGVTTGGAPGRRGGPRMRGLGGGYTQMLINGEPIPAGFSLESLTPEQVERIEILRAPTAEYGARAVAGTINIVLREALQKRLNDLRFGTTVEAGYASPGISWTRNDKLGEGAGNAYNLSVSVFRRNRADPIDNRTTISRIDSGATTLEQHETGVDRDHRLGINLSSRLQWRLGDGDSLSLQPFLLLARSDGTGRRHLEQPIGSTAAPYSDAEIDSDNRLQVMRLNAQWQKRLAASSRLDLRLGGGGFDSDSGSRRQEFDAAGVARRRLDEDSSTRERSLSSLGKLSHELASEHSLVTGWDVELIRRSERRSSVQNGVALLTGFNNELDASSQRLALYIQDEWNPSKQWSAYAGLRWEQIATRSDGAADPVSQRSAVWTPLLQAVWKPNEKSRDQIRVALTRSYKSPTLRNLIARPSLSTRYPAPGGNEATSPDSIGNPQLRPELATGIDLAYEHYLSAGGLVSVNLFHRRISDLIRNVTSLQTVPWAQQPRWVSQPRNIGDAVTQGIELEAKARLNELRAGLPPVALRSNLSLFQSRVDGVPGPDNRLEEQPSATANLGADYRFRGMPLSVGGNLNWTPSYVVQQSDTQRRSASTKRSFEAFAIWAFNPGLSLRVGASDLLPLDYQTVSSVDTGSLRDSSENRSTTRTQWTLRLEMKL
ncbi:TonB-dependent receptor plug domain-containing protein [Piscinibacter sakaiensis]|uniref:TonB-dependent receptor plug domain-containing protein n=1 Tax=Piscinibacter sakaiensis TaxID=1547922 RepID=UPI003AAFFD95